MVRARGSAFEDRVVVVTGGTAGAGRAIVRAFARRGARLGVIARDEGRLDATMKDLADAGTTGFAVPADVADAAAVDQAAATIEAELGEIDVWVNNAMTSVFARFVDVAPDEFRRVTEVTYLGFVYGTRAALQRMLPRDRGRIVQVGSALAERGIPLQSAYCGAKHAIQGFTESVRCELLDAHSRVSIGMVQMPALNTPQFDWVRSRLSKRAQPVPPIFQPEVAAEAVVAFAARPRRTLWVGWPTTRAIAANRVVPGLLDHYLGRTGVKAQQTDEPQPADAPDNLWAPVPADVAAHGRFDASAHARSAGLWASLHKRVLALSSALVAVAAIVIALTSGR